MLICLSRVFITKQFFNCRPSNPPRVVRNGEKDPFDASMLFEWCTCCCCNEHALCYLCVRMSVCYRGMFESIHPQAEASVAHPQAQHNIPHVRVSACVRRLLLSQRCHLLHRQDRRVPALQLRVSIPKPPPYFLFLFSPPRNNEIYRVARKNLWELCTSLVRSQGVVGGVLLAGQVWGGVSGKPRGPGALPGACTCSCIALRDDSGPLDCPSIGLYSLRKLLTHCHLSDIVEVKMMNCYRRVQKTEQLSVASWGSSGRVRTA